MSLFVLFADARQGIEDFGADFIDVIVERFEGLKEYLDYIWVTKLAVKVGNRIRLWVQTGGPPYELVFEDRPLTLTEIYKLYHISHRRFVHISANGSIVIVMLPMWEKDP